MEANLPFIQQLPLLLTLKQAAELLGISEKQLVRQSCFREEVEKAAQILVDHKVVYYRYSTTSTKYVFYLPEILEAIGINLVNYYNQSESTSDNQDSSEENQKIFANRSFRSTRGRNRSAYDGQLHLPIE